MFGFFKRPSKPQIQKQGDLAGLLSFDDISYANAIFRLFERMDAATRAHVVVAYQNLLPILSVLYTHAQETGESVTVEEFIRRTVGTLDSYTDEINSRRMSWFLFAAYLARMEKLARENSAIATIAARIWCVLVAEIPRLKVLLPNNVVWKPEEKTWFDLSLSDSEMIQTGINHFIPPVFARLDPVKELAKSLGVFYWPNKTRIGYVP